MSFCKCRPCKTTRVTSHFGWRVHPVTGSKTHHNGVDFAPVKKTQEKIYAVADGTVEVAGWDSGGGGYYIRIRHDKYRTRYLHLKKGSLKVKAGQKVKAGKHIANMGATGKVTGEHLDFRVQGISSGKYYNPVPMLKGLTTTPKKDAPTGLTKKAKIKKVQSLIGTKADGVWGVKTQKAYHSFIKEKANIKELQKVLNEWTSPKLKVDGIAGVKTRTAVNKLK